MKDKLVVVKSAVVYTQNGCPICGGYKTKKARTCRDCRNKLGAKATEAVDAIIVSANKAREGNQNAIASSVQRNAKWGGRMVLANIEIADGTKRSGNGKVGDYFRCEISENVKPAAAYVELFVFGADDEDNGRFITALVELKTKKNNGRILHYLRAQKVPDYIISDVSLRIFPHKSVGNANLNLPIEQISEPDRSFKIGFSL